MRQQGKITTWNDDRGFGFITPRKGGDRVFFHIKSFQQHGERPSTNRWVTYDLSTDAEGRPRAVDVVPAGKTSRSKSTISLLSILALLFFAILAGLAGLGSLPIHLVAWYGILSLVTYLFYAEDKDAAQRGRWRTAESTLQFLALFGGWPGALVAQQRLRHKTRKVSFQLVFWVMVVMNCMLLAWLTTPQGARELQALLAQLPWPPS